MTTWDPGQYGRYKQERSAPFYDLLALVRPEERMRVVDLGCGTGELTRELHLRLAAAQTLGLDSSPEMLRASGAYAGPGLRFEESDIEGFRPEAPLDLIFSNAALQWVPDHETLLPRLTELLAPGGQLAVQVPANHDHPSHEVAKEVAGEEPFRSALGGWTRTSPVLAPERYAMLLDRLGYREQHVRLQVYGHHLGGREEVVEWVKCTLLTAYTGKLAPALHSQFLERYRECLLPLLEDTRPYFYPFKRILFWARR